MGNLSANDQAAIQSAAASSGVPIGLLYAVQGAETGSYASPDTEVSRTGATGLFQILPSTAAQPGFGIDPLAASSLTDPAANANFAGKYLSALYNKYGSWSQAINAYVSGYPDKAGGYTYAQLQNQYPQWFDGSGNPISDAGQVMSGSTGGTSLYGTPLPGTITSDQVGVAGLLGQAKTQMSAGFVSSTVNSVMSWIGTGVLQGATVLIGVVVIVLAFVFLIVESKTVQTGAATLARAA